jgi:membrane-bound inhibitor of C-type lysozyme
MPRRFVLQATVVVLTAISVSGAIASAAGRPASDTVGITATLNGHLYWTDPETARGSGGPGIDTIGRARRDGTVVEKNFISGVEIPGAVAIAGHYIYWTNGETDQIGRANLDGTHVNRNFIPVRGLSGALAIHGQRIYWSSGSTPSNSARIGRANLDGSHIEQSFMSVGPGTFIGGLAADQHHIYWTNRDNGTVGQADLNGRHINRHLIRGLKAPTGLAVNREDLYWASDPTDGSNAAIGRARLNGSHVNERFITGVTEPFGVAVDAQYVYWTNYAAGSIGRASLNGSDVNQNFILAGATVPQGESAPMGLAVGP